MGKRTCPSWGAVVEQVVSDNVDGQANKVKKGAMTEVELSDLQPRRKLLRSLGWGGRQKNQGSQQAELGQRQRGAAERQNTALSQVSQANKKEKRVGLEGQTTKHSPGEPLKAGSG